MLYLILTCILAVLVIAGLTYLVHEFRSAPQITAADDPGGHVRLSRLDREDGL